MLDPNGFSSKELNTISEFGHEHQTSVLTMMFTDLCGSTKMWEELGEKRASDVRSQHHSRERDIIERECSGRVIKTIGDAIFAVFSEPSRAVERAVEIQAYLAMNEPSEYYGTKLQERIGLHLGQVLLEQQVSEDIFGRHVNRAARIEAATPPGHVFASHAVWDSANGWVDGQYCWHYHGEYMLKGIPYPERIWEVIHPPITKPEDAVGIKPADRSEHKKEVKPGVVLIDRDGLPRVALEAALNRRGLVDTVCCGSPLSAYHPLEERNIHAIYFNLEAGRTLDESLQFVHDVRTRWPAVVIVLFVNWTQLAPKLPELWRERFEHYFYVDRNSPLERLERDVAASIEGIRYDLMRGKISIFWPSDPRQPEQSQR